MVFLHWSIAGMFSASRRVLYLPNIIIMYLNSLVRRYQSLSCIGFESKLYSSIHIFRYRNEYVLPFSTFTPLTSRS
jgi:hypothetical protein